MQTGIDMLSLSGFQKKYLRGLAHGMKPVVFVGQKGMNAMLIRAINEALDGHELIKIKFIEFKQKNQKEELCRKIENNTESVMVGLIGHIGIFFRAHSDPGKRKIDLPQSQ